MATDARIAVGLPSHPKTKKLIKRLGQASAWNLVCLILWAASNRSDGNLCGMSVEDIELSADWQGADGALVEALVAVRFLDEVDGSFVLHDWQEHNPWAAGADMRSAKARWNAAKRHHGDAEADRLVPEYAAVRSATSNATSKKPAQDEQGRSSAPSPSPSPSPSQEPKGSVADAPAKTVTARMLEAEGIEKQTATDWLTLRKAKRLPLTPTAWEDTKAEGMKVGLSPAETVAHAVRCNWAGFKAIWFNRDVESKPGPAVSFAQQDKADKRAEWEAMTGRKWPSADTVPEFIEAEEITPKRITA